jgi:hypothetical protein
MRTTSLAIAEWLTRLPSEQIRSCGIPGTSSHVRCWHKADSPSAPEEGPLPDPKRLLAGIYQVPQLPGQHPHLPSLGFGPRREACRRSCRALPGLDRAI